MVTVALCARQARSQANLVKRNARFVLGEHILPHQAPPLALNTGVLRVLMAKKFLQNKKELQNQQNASNALQSARLVTVECVALPANG
jgi:hypothetical protein